MGNFQDILDRFIELGGTAENICLRKGELGRGIFPLDSLRRSKIFTPKNLLIDRSDVCISRDEIHVKGSSRFSSKEKNFIELYYNYAWNGGGSSCSAEFLKYVSVAWLLWTSAPLTIISEKNGRREMSWFRR